MRRRDVAVKGKREMKFGIGFQLQQLIKRHKHRHPMLHEVITAAMRVISVVFHLEIENDGLVIQEMYSVGIREYQNLSRTQMMLV